MRKVLLASCLALAALCAVAQSHPGLVNGLRGAAPLEAESKAPAFAQDGQRRPAARAQPPRAAAGDPAPDRQLQVDLRFNKCMDCHGRSRVGESQAPMVSVTHFQDRDGQIRQEISPRRYFCTQCHVSQADVRVPVRNTFQDFYEVQPDPPAKGPRK
jgi:cytochrome c-type protein NapB